MGSKRWWKCSVKSVRSVREKLPQRVVCVSSHRVGVFYFSQKNTDEQNTQGFTETLSQPISQNVTATEASPPAPLRMERGVNTEIPLRFLRMLSSLSPIISKPIGVTSHTNYQLTPSPSPPPKGRGVITEIPL